MNSRRSSDVEEQKGSHEFTLFLFPAAGHLPLSSLRASVQLAKTCSLGRTKGKSDRELANALQSSITTPRCFLHPSELRLVETLETHFTSFQSNWTCRNSTPKYERHLILRLIPSRTASKAFFTTTSRSLKSLPRPITIRSTHCIHQGCPQRPGYALHSP